MDDDTKREIANLKQYFELVIANNDERYRQTAEAQREALALARSSNDKRLDGMNEFRAALSDQSAGMITRQEFDSTRATLLDKNDQLKHAQDSRFDAELKPIASRLEQIGKPNWMLLVSFVSIFFVMITGVWLVIGLKIDATVGPMSLDLAEVKAIQATDTAVIRTQQNLTSASMEADATSRTDRAQLNERIRSLEGAVVANAGEQRAKFGVLDASLIEIETQFCASDVVRNLIQADDMRLFSMLWHKAFPDVALPTDNAFYPKICRSGAANSTSGK
jgi:hypothetical protein